MLLAEPLRPRFSAKYFTGGASGAAVMMPTAAAGVDPTGFVAPGTGVSIDEVISIGLSAAVRKYLHCLESWSEKTQASLIITQLYTIAYSTTIFGCKQGLRTMCVPMCDHACVEMWKNLFIYLCMCACKAACRGAHILGARSMHSLGLTASEGISIYVQFLSVFGWRWEGLRGRVEGGHAIPMMILVLYSVR